MGLGVLGHYMFKFFFLILFSIQAKKGNTGTSFPVPPVKAAVVRAVTFSYVK